MGSPVSLRIPSSDEPGIKLLIQMHEEQFSRLREVLAEPGYSDPLELATKVAGALNLDLRVAETLVRVASNLYKSFQTAKVSEPDFMRILADGVKNSRTLSNIDIPSTFESRVRALLNLEDGLGLATKAMEVHGEHEKGFCSARILTDLRPIFGQKPTEDPVGFVLFHQLKIGYDKDEGHFDEYFALSSEELLELKSIIDRAIEKEATLRRVSAGAKLKLFDL